MKIYLYILSISLFSNFIYSQKFAWAKGFSGTPNWCSSEKIFTDSNKNIYVMGYFAGTVNFNPNGSNLVTATSTPTNIPYEPYLCKLDSNGAFKWVRTWRHDKTNSQGLYFRNFTVDNAGNVYIIGNYSGTIDFNPNTSVSYTTTAFGGGESFLLKVNSLGIFQWTSQIYASSYDTEITVDNSSNIIFTMNSFGSIFYKTNSTTTNLSTPVSNYSTLWLFKVNSSGQFLFAKKNYPTTGTSVSNRPYNIQIDNLNNIFVVGGWESLNNQATINVDSDFSYLIPANKTGNSIVKYNSSGNFQYGYLTNSSNTKISLLPSNDICLLSFTNNGGDFKYMDLNSNISSLPLPTGFSSSKSVLSISHIDNNNGNLLMHKNLLQYNSVSSNVALPTFRFDKQGSIYYHNKFQSSNYIQFNLISQTGTISTSQSQPVSIVGSIVKFGANGNYCMSTPEFNSGIDFYVDRSQSIYLTGRCFSGNSVLDLQPGPTVFNLPSDDVFITKLGFCNPPNVTLIAPSNSICINTINGTAYQSEFIKVNTTDTAPTYTFNSNFNWAIGGGHYPDSSMITSPGIYSVTVNNQCDFASRATASVNISAYPQVPCNFDKTLPCNGAGGTYTVNYLGSSPNYTIAWNNGTIGNINSAIFPGQVSTFTVTDVNGCKYSSANLIMNQEYQISLPSVYYASCGGNGVQLNAQQISGTGLTNYSWLPLTDLNNPYIPNPIASPTQNTTYTLTSENQSCFKTYTTNVNLYYLSNFIYTTNGLSVTFTNGNLQNPNLCPYFLWDFGNGMQNSLATNPSVTYNNPGLYTACLKCGNIPQECIACTTFSLPANGSGGTDVGVFEYKNANSEIKFYPNPTNGYFYIESNENTVSALGKTVTVSNLLGETLISQKLQEGKNEIDLSNQSNGIYFLTCDNQTFKIIKQ